MRGAHPCQTRVHPACLPAYAGDQLILSGGFGIRHGVIGRVLAVRCKIDNCLIKAAKPPQF
jgi:hypothetical protein